MASATGTTGRASNVKAGNIEQNLCTSSGSSHSINMYPPQSPTRMTNDRILKLAGAFHGLKTSKIRFCAFSYSMDEPCGRSFQVIMYCMQSTLSFTRVRVAVPVVGKIYASRHARVEPYQEEFLRPSCLIAYPLAETWSSKLEICCRAALAANLSHLLPS